MDIDIMISAATHRSGSTLLQRIFNVRKKTLIWGEQNGLLTNFYQVHKNLKGYSINHRRQRLNYFNNDENPNYWIACMTPEISFVDQAVTDSLKVLFDRLYEQNRDGHDIVGFKEVRYGEDEISLFRKCYPEAKIVLLVRDPVHVWKSMKGTALGRNINNFAKKWNNHATYYLQLAKNDPNAYLLKYEDIVNNNPETLKTISQLGHLSLEEIGFVVKKKIRSTTRDITDDEVKAIVNECGETMELYGYHY